jgi:hypothetical protein
MNRTINLQERGQVLIIAAFAFAALVGVAAVVLDLGNGMLERRRLQNVADAAALAAAREIAYGGPASESAAAAVAQQMVRDSTNNTVSLPYPPPADGGSGVGLTNGIEFYYNGNNGLDSVRVALRKNVPAFLAGILGQDRVTVAVRSRAAMTALGVLPVAARRYAGQNPDVPLGVSPNAATAQDFLRRAGSDTISSWDHFTTPPSDVVATVDNPGTPFPFAAQQAIPPIGPSDSFRGIISPYIRNLSGGGTFLPPTYPTSSASSWRELSDLLFTHKMGYTGPMVLVNEEVACLGGTNAGDTAKMLMNVFPIGTRVIALVYDGRVYGLPDFSMKISGSATQQHGSLPKGAPDAPPTPTSNPPGSPIEFTVDIVPGSGFGSSSYGLTINVRGLDNWNGDHVRWRLCEGSDCGGVFQPRPVGLTSSGKSVKLQIWAANLGEDPPLDLASITGARMITVEAQSSIGASGTNFHAAVAGLLVGSNPSFYVFPEVSTRVITPGQSTDFVMTMTRSSNWYNMANASVGSPQWLDASGNWVGGPPSGVTATIATTTVDANTKKATLSITSNTFTPVGTWRMRVPFDDATTAGEDSYLMLTFRVRSSVENWLYVRVLGYAAYEITNYRPNLTNPNSVEARAISGLYSDPNDIGLGMTVRLIGWSQ